MSNGHPRPAPTLGRRIGLLGGSFNPAHSGHRHISLVALRRLGLDQVWWLVSPQNPLKSAADMAPLESRLRHAAELASHPRIVPTAIENRLGTRYTVDTVHALRRLYPGTLFVWLMGADNLIQFTRWRRWTDMAEALPIAVIDRPGYSLKALASLFAHRYRAARLPAEAAWQLPVTRPPAWVFLRDRLHPASATAIRQGRSAPATGRIAPFAASNACFSPAVGK